MIKCMKCGRDLGYRQHEGLVASIAGSIMGDEYIDTYFYCDRCEVYTLEVYHDHFSGEEESSLRGPITKVEGDIKIELIRQCEQPWNKKCRCAAHRSYFGDSLD